MCLISLHYQENCVWTRLKCHTSPAPNPWGARLSPQRPSRVRGWRRMTFQSTYGHLCNPGINKGGIYRKHIFLSWVGREGHNDQTLTFSMKWCVVWLSHLPYCGTQSIKENGNHHIDFLRKISTDD